MRSLKLNYELVYDRYVSFRLAAKRDRAAKIDAQSRSRRPVARFRGYAELRPSVSWPATTVPGPRVASIAFDNTREEVQERLALRACERGHDPFLSRRDQRFQAPPQPGAASATIGTHARLSLGSTRRLISPMCSSRSIVWLALTGSMPRHVASRR